MRRLTLVVLLALAPAAAWAATPASGDVDGGPFATTPDGGINDTTWAGTPKIGVVSPPVQAETVAQQCLGATPLPQCDVFTLTFRAPATYWQDAAQAGFSGNIEVHLSGLDAAVQEDVDLYVFDSNQALVCTSGNAAGLDEDCLIPKPTPGAAYSVVAYYYTNAVATDAYQGRASLNLIADTSANTEVGNAIQFYPTTWADLQRSGAEPMINVSHQGDGRVYVDWPFSTQLATSVVSRSTDDGDTFKTLYNTAATNNSTLHTTRVGGGDSEVTLAPSGLAVYAADQEEVANFNITSSPNGGFTWPNETPVSSQTTDVDRMWMGALRSQDAWIAYHQVGVGANVYWNVTHNGGQTWSPLETLQTAYYTAEQTGPMVADVTGVNAGALYHMFHNSTSISVAVTTDGGPSFATHDVGGDFGGIFPWLAADTAGNLYAVWTSASGADVMIATSLATAPENVGAPATRWSPPVRVSAPPAQTAVMAEVAAGSPGRVAILFYGTDQGDQPDTAPANAQWHAYVAMSTEALCTWNAVDGSIAPCANAMSSPHFIQSPIDYRTSHQADICTQGTTCTGNRNLADMIDIGYDPDGRLVATWSDDLNDGNRDFMRVGRQMTGPSLIQGNPDFADTVPATSVTDPSGDAFWPNTALDVAMAEDAGGGAVPVADLTQFSVSDLDGNVSFHFTVAQAGLVDGGGAFPDAGNPFLAAMNLAEGSTTGKRLVYAVRWQSPTDDYFAALEYNGNGTIQAFGGPIDANTGMEASQYTGAVGYDLTTSPTDAFPPQAATWSISGSELVITAPLSAFAIVADGGPAFVAHTANGRLLNVVGAVMVGDDETTETNQHMKNVLDATRALVYDLTGATSGDGGVIVIPDAGAPDAGEVVDAGEPDAGEVIDAGAPDAGELLDAGSTTSGSGSTGGTTSSGSTGGGTVGGAGGSGGGSSAGTTSGNRSAKGGGCNCGSVDGNAASLLMLTLGGLVLARRRRR